VYNCEMMAVMCGTHVYLSEPTQRREHVQAISSLIETTESVICKLRWQWRAVNSGSVTLTKTILLQGTRFSAKPCLHNLYYGLCCSYPTKTTQLSLCQHDGMQHLAPVVLLMSALSCARNVTNPPEQPYRHLLLYSH
jgi:hypothetical protein